MTRLWLLQLVLYFLGFKVIPKQKITYIHFEFVCIKKCDIWIEVLELKNKNDKIVSSGWHVVFFITTLSQKIFCLAWYQFDDSYIRHIGVICNMWNTNIMFSCWHMKCMTLLGSNYPCPLNTFYQYHIRIPQTYVCKHKS